MERKMLNIHAAEHFNTLVVLLTIPTYAVNVHEPSIKSVKGLLNFLNLFFCTMACNG